MSQNKKSKPTTYFVFKGEIGYYDDIDTAVLKAGSASNVLPIASSSPTQALPLLLKNIAYTRKDVDFKKLYPFIKEKDIRILESIKRKGTYTVAYANRLISSNGESRYGIWFQNSASYYYISPLPLVRKHVTDEVILLKIKELSESYFFHGKLYLPFPTDKISHILPNWEILNMPSYAYNLPMISLVELLKGNSSLIPVEPLT